ncbi:hypothetical protein FO519_009443 [Halicephalobus sp. NKZ332]|nr:hypothetical protein FO519_009443 [Halicephalobus sp. NKZ332]
MEDPQKIYFFAYSEESEQIAQLHGYLEEKGAKLKPLGDDRLANVAEVVKGSSVLASNAGDELEEVFNSILSIIIGFTQEEAFQLIQDWGNIVLSGNFKGTGWQSQAGVAVIVFSNLFHFYDTDPKMKLYTFKVLLELAGRARVTEAIDLDQSTVNGYFKEWNLSKDEQISVLHILHKALLADGRGRDAAEVMTKLLKTYSDSDASKIENDAIECVRTAIVDPKAFSFDHLLHIKAIQQLEKSKPDLFKLLKVFSYGTLPEFKEFVKAHPDFIKSQLKFDDSSLLKKIKILTLITLSEANKNLSYETLKKELEITNDEDLEKFLIDVLQSKAINGKLNGVKKEFSITAMEQRTFGRKEWQKLREDLANLLENLQRTKKNLDVAADPSQLNGLLHYR